MFVPGLIVGVAARLRPFQLAAFAAPISVSVVSLAAIVAPWLGLTWSGIPVALGTLVAALVCGLVAWRTRRGNQASRPDWRQSGKVLSGVAALAVAAVLIGRRLMYVFGTPDSLSQTFDNIFHLNAVRYILDTGNASSMFVSTLTGGGFYPAAWHDIVALVAGPGIEITVATNVVNLVIGSVVWPLSMMALTRALVGERPAALWLAAVFSTGFGAFPILLLDFGVLFPNFLGTALLPAIVALLVRALGIGAEAQPGRLMTALLLLMSVPGLALAHPNSLMTLLAVALPLLLMVWAGWVRRRGFASGRILPIGVLVGGLFVAAAAWALIRPPSSAATWAPVETVGQAVGELLALSGIGRPPTWLPAILALVGIAWAVRPAGRRWFLGVYAVIGLLFVVVAGMPFGKLRTALTGVYYNDPPRLAALLPVIGIPLAVAGGLWVWDRGVLLVGRYWGRGRPEATRILLPAAAVVAIALSAVAIQTSSIRDAANAAAGSYRITPSAPLISTDEMALLERLDSETPADAVLVGNPWNGSSLAYAIADRRTAQAHILSEVPPGLPTIYDHLNDAKNDPAVCQAVKSLHITYVLDFGHHEVHGGDHGVKGLDNLTQSGIAQIVDQQGTAKLLRITACGNQG
ncbi:DUF6541 family protein [Sinomonas sp. G460-2]|uniref:DUF6541 family protein n=1 Tax=Sinomonas sp. G460-2 TaxID=3393464 RepID=UPI0039EF3837